MARAKPRVVRNPAAIVDLAEIADFLAQTTSLTAADRFLAAATGTFEQLARTPGMGTRYEPDDPAYAELRYFPIAKFRKYLAFYCPLPDGIQVVRVLHGARDIAGILRADLGIPEEESDEAAP